MVTNLGQGLFSLSRHVNTRHYSGEDGQQLTLLVILYLPHCTLSVPNPRSSVSDIDLAVTEYIIGAFEAACPYRRVGSTTDKPWMNGELKNIRRNSRRAFKKAK